MVSIVANSKYFFYQGHPMKTCPTWLRTYVFVALSLFIGLFSSQQVLARPRIDADAAPFYDALRPYGEWISHRTYGTVWYPTGIPRNWRPYTDGHWDYTQQYGWLWVSDQPWGWAPFHYGRWAWDNWYGWVWVPGRTWAPAWVFWRFGGGYAAWSPMPPTVLWQPNYGLNTRYFDYDRDLHWDCWVAVPEYNFTNRNMRQHIFAPNQNRNIIRNTNHINNLTVINQSIVNQGIPVTRIEQITGSPVTTVVPIVNEHSEIHRGRSHNEDRPEIIRPISAGNTTPEELRKHEEIAVKLDQEKTISLNPPASNETQVNGSDNQEQPRVPERLKHEHASTKLHPAPNTPSSPERTQLTEPVLPETLPNSLPVTTTSEDRLQSGFDNSTVTQEMAPEAIRPANSEGLSPSTPAVPANLSIPNDQNHSKPLEETISLPIKQDPNPGENLEPAPVQNQEPPVQIVPEEPTINQQAIQPQTLSDQESLKPIQTIPQLQEGTTVQDVQIQPPVETQPVPVEVQPVQIQEPVLNQQPHQQIQQQETFNQAPSTVPEQTGNLQQEIPVQETQVEQAAPIMQPEPPATQPELPSQPAIQIQQQPETPQQPNPPSVPQQEIPSQPKNTCQTAEQTDCSK